MNFTPRLYQEKIFSTCALKNTLVVLPTGLGKTNIFVMVAAQRLKQYPQSQILLIGPTRPLISQYYDVFKETAILDEQDMAIMTGNVSPKKRAQLWEQATIIFSTPQGLENDIIAGRARLDMVSLLGVDEAHRAVKDYPYVWIAKSYMNQAQYPRIVGLTASPGSDKEKIMEVCRNLYIEDIEVRSPEDPDVKPYVKDIEISYVTVSLPPELSEVHGYLSNGLQSKLQQLKDNGFLQRVKQSQLNKLSKKELISLQGELTSQMSQGERDYSTMRALSLIAEAMKLSHGMELLESQGLSVLHEYLQKLLSEARKSKVKAVQNLTSDENFKAAAIRTERLVEEGVEHPKVAKLTELVKACLSKEDEKLIIFTQFRDTAVRIASELEQYDNVTPRVFVGQQKKGDTGLSQKQQIEMLEEFRQGVFNTIIMTSVGEEGLDIPKVDNVIFYEPVPSVIRYIQRRGRTGRQEKGRVMVLMTKGTRDEVYRWSSYHQEKRMHEILSDIKKSLAVEKKHPTLNDFSSTSRGSSALQVCVDHRERGSHVIKELINSGAEVQLEQLESADYVPAPRVGIEYKKVADFVNSLVDGRLLEQIKELRDNYERPLVIVEGEEDLYSVRNVHPNAIKGALSAILIGYGVPVLYTKTSRESADMVYTIAKRENEGSGSYQPHSEKKAKPLAEQQELIVSSLPNVGPSLARQLLRRFRSVEQLAQASVEQLMQVENVGKKKAEQIRELFTAHYDQ